MIFLFTREAFQSRSEWAACQRQTLEHARSIFTFLSVTRVARPAIGMHDADKFVPLLWTIFLFVLVMQFALA